MLSANIHGTKYAPQSPALPYKVYLRSKSPLKSHQPTHPKRTTVKMAGLVPVIQKRLCPHKALEW